MDLYLVRHAIAADRDSTLWPDDRDRPLTAKGVRRFKRQAKGLLRLVPEVDVLLASPLERARHTASILHKAGWPEAEPLEELAQGDPGALVRALQEYRDLESIALVGHEPYLSRFAAAVLGLSKAPWTELGKGGVVNLRLPQPSLIAGGELRLYLPPRLLRELGR